MTAESSVGKAPRWESNALSAPQIDAEPTEGADYQRRLLTQELGLRLISSGLWHSTQSPLMIMVHKGISQHSFKPITHFILFFFLWLNLSVGFHVPGPGWGEGGWGPPAEIVWGLVGVSLVRYPEPAFINNYLTLPYYAYYMPASTWQMRLQGDEVVVVERGEQIPTCGIQEKLRERHRQRERWMKWVGKHGRQIRHIGIQLHLAALASRPGW